jgi:hypothetical protein
MPTTREISKRRRSGAVPLSLVPALAALVSVSACSSRKPLDPCEPASFSQPVCENAVANRGYWHSGTWYPHVYPFAAMYYLTRHNDYVRGGGRVRSISPTVYSPRVASPSRPGVIRGGFGGIGSGRVAGS